MRTHSEEIKRLYQELEEKVGTLLIQMDALGYREGQTIEVVQVALGLKVSGHTANGERACGFVEVKKPRI